MALADMDSLQFYQPPVKAGVRSDERPTTSSVRVPAPHWGKEDLTALGASQGSSGVLHKSDLIQPQNPTRPLQKDSLDSFCTSGLGRNGSKADKLIASERRNMGWDDLIPLSCQGTSDRLDRPFFWYPTGTSCKTNFPEKSTAGKVACDPIEVDSGDEDASSEDSSSKAGYKTSSATTPTCALSPGLGSLKENRIGNTVFGGGDTKGPDAATPTPQECRASGWLDIDSFPDYHWGFADIAAEDKPQKQEDIQDELGPDHAENRHAEDGPHEIEHNVSGDEDEVGTVENNDVADLEMVGIEVDGQGLHAKDGHKARADGDAERDQNSSDSRILRGPAHSSLPHIARRGRGRPRRSRTAITASHATWEAIKIAGEKQSGKGQLVLVLAEAWLAEEDFPPLRDAIASYRSKQGGSRGKRKSICGGQKRIARRRAA